MHLDISLSERKLLCRLQKMLICSSFVVFFSTTNLAALRKQSFFFFFKQEANFFCHYIWSKCSVMESLWVTCTALGRLEMPVQSAENVQDCCLWCLIPFSILSVVCMAHWLFFSLQRCCVRLCKNAMNLKWIGKKKNAYFMKYKKSNAISNNAFLQRVSSQQGFELSSATTPAIQLQS